MNYYTPMHPIEGVSPVSQNPSSDIIDLIKGKLPYGVECETPIGEDCHTVHFNTPVEAFTLTNGVMAQSPDFNDTAFTHFTHGTARSIYYRLDNLSAIKGFSASFLLQRKVGIRIPNRLDVFLSIDGKNWQRVHKQRSILANGDPSITKVEFDFDNIYKASWVRFDIATLCHVWVEHLSLYGSTLIPETAVMPVNDNSVNERKSLYIDSYPEYSDLNGVQNIFLAYNCMPPEADENAQKLTSYSVEEALPYFGYVNKEGKMEDSFFDSALFLPYSRFTYSKHYKSAQGWQYYIDNTFEEGKNMDAFNTAAGEVAKTLGRDFKVQIFLSIFHTAPHYGDFPEKFGDIDGDGIDEDLSTFEGKCKVTKWFIDTQIARFNEKEREHLNLCGFYWFEEDIVGDTEHELEVLYYARDYVHSLGYKLIWIPYYQAPGYTEWTNYGFDVACMQPNYAFNSKIPVKRLYDNAVLAKRFGLCYELEINDVNNPADCDKYKEYLQCGVETGFMKTIKMYYQDCRAFWIAYNSKDEFIRSVYDDTYLFAKEKLVKATRLEK